MHRIEELWSIYQNQFADTGLKKGAFSAPGRVNLIGEHTDYNEGFVLPMAINKGIFMLGQLRKDRMVKVYSIDYDHLLTFQLEELTFDQENIWVNYIKGIIEQYRKSGYDLTGVNIVFTGNIPQGAGLSSSAALEVVTAYLLASLHEIKMSAVEMALLCQRAEREFVGVNCGIMDQYIAVMGQADHALIIDCRSNQAQPVPLDDQGYSIVICNSKVKRELVDSAYNQRRNECVQAVTYFQQKLKEPVKALRDVNLVELQAAAADLTEQVFRRCRHVITENERVLQAVAALRANDFPEFGQLMIASHLSLRDDYEVSCRELDCLVELALEKKGVLGARMTGAGFGGCTVNLLKENRVEAFAKQIKAEYQEKTGLVPEIYCSAPSNGAGKL